MRPPSTPIVRIFQTVVHPVLEFIVANNHKPRTLTTPRDALLPKLV